MPIETKSWKKVPAAPLRESGGISDKYTGTIEIPRPINQ